MLTVVYNFLAFIMLIWYSCIRWTMFSNDLGTFIEKSGVKTFKLNWWFAPINILTALGTIYILYKSLFSVSYELSFDRELYPLAAILFLRFIYETIEDVWDYFESTHTRQQLFFILIDLLSVLVLGMFMVLVKINHHG